MKSGVGLFASVVLLTSCSSFGSNKESAPPGGSDGGSLNPDGTPPVNGRPATPGVLGLKADASVRLTLGGSAKVAVSVAKGSFTGTVTVTAVGLPAGIDAPSLVLTQSASGGELVLSGTASTQGVIPDVTIEAVAQDGRKDAVPLALSVRGARGSVDTTYATAGFIDLADATATARSTATHLVVSTASGGVHRYLHDGTEDASFTPVPSRTVSAIAPDNSIFTVDSRSISHYFSNGSADTAFAGVSPSANSFNSGPQVGAGPANSTVIAGATMFHTLHTSSVTAGGVIGTDNEFIYTAGTVSELVPGCLTPVTGGKYLMGAGSNAGRVSLLRLNASSTVDTGFGVSGVGEVSVNGTALRSEAVDIRSTPQGIYLLAGRGGAAGINLARFDANGAIDTAFGGSTGIQGVSQPPLADDPSAAMDIDAMGRPMLATTTTISGVSVFAISRFAANGAADGTFGTNGFVTLDLGTALKVYRFVVVDEEHALLVGARDGKAFITRLWL